MDIKDAKVFGVCTFINGSLTFSTGTTVDLSKATVLLPANAVNAANLASFTGSTANAPGGKGVVPAPPASANAAGLFLNAAGQFVVPGVGGSVLNPDIVDATSKTDDFTSGALSARWTRTAFGYLYTPAQSIVTLQSYAYEGGVVVREFEAFAESVSLNGQLWTIIGKVRFTNTILPVDGSAAGITVFNAAPGSNDSGQPGIGLCLKAVGSHLHVVSEYQQVTTDAPGDPGGFDVTLPDSQIAAWTWLKLDGYGRCFYSLDGNAWNYLGVVNFSTPVPGANGAGSIALTADVTFAGLYTRAVSGSISTNRVNLDCDLFYCELHSHNFATEGSNYLTNPMQGAGDMVVGLASGTPSRLGVGAAGQVLTIVNGLPHWAAPTGGDGSSGGSSGGGGTTIIVGGGGGVEVDTPPASPSPYNDEFEGTTLDPKWTLDSSTPSAVGTTRTGTVRGGNLILASSTSIQDRRFSCLQPAPGDAFSIYAKCTFEERAANYNGVGIMLRNANNGNSVTFFLLSRDGLYFWYCRLNDASGNGGWVSESNLGIRTGDTHYLRADFDGNGTLSFYASRTGLSWGSVPILTETVSSFLGAITHVGLNMHPYQSPGEGVIDWFRVVTGAYTDYYGQGGAAGVGATDTPNPAPDAASALDDEFTSATLANKWAWINQSGATATVLDGWLTLTAPGVAGDSLAVFGQAAPSGDFSIETDVIFSGSAQNYPQGGLIVYNAATGQAATLDLVFYNGAYQLIADCWNSLTNHRSTMADINAQPQRAVLRIVVAGNDIHFLASGTPGVVFPNQIAADTVSNILGGGITHVGLYASGSGNQTAALKANYFRCKVG